MTKKEELEKQLTDPLYSGKREELVGREVIILQDSTGHGYNKNTLCIIKSIPEDTRQPRPGGLREDDRVFCLISKNGTNKNRSTRNVYAVDIRLSPATLSEYKTLAEIHELEGKIYDEKIEYLEETGQAFYDRMSFTAWKVMKMFNVEKEAMDNKFDEFVEYLALE